MHTLAATQNSMPQHCWPGRCAAARAAARAERALSPRAELRSARARFKKGQLSAADYEKHINEYMQYAIREQERIGLDVLVHGEPERTDMCATPPGTARRGWPCPAERWARIGRAGPSERGHGQPEPTDTRARCPVETAVPV
jgi:hypothetical protein